MNVAAEVVKVRHNNQKKDIVARDFDSSMVVPADFREVKAAKADAISTAMPFADYKRMFWIGRQQQRRLLHLAVSDIRKIRCSCPQA